MVSADVLLSYFCVLLFGISQTVYGQNSLNCWRSYFSNDGAGIIESYNFPFNYRDYIACNVTLQINTTNDQSSHKEVCLTFRRFELEKEYDFLYVWTANDVCQYTGWGFLVNTGASGCPGHIWAENTCFNARNNGITFEFKSDAHVTMSGFYANYTVKDVINSEGNSTALAEYEPCSTTSMSWTCFNRKCVFDEEKCNSVNECGDDSDESYAHARCTSGPGKPGVKACDFQDRSSCQFDGIGGGWVVDDGVNHRGKGPASDHTVGHSGEGAFARTKFWAVSAPPDVTMFDLSFYFDPGKDYCLSFFYHMDGHDAGRLQVDIQYLGASLINSVWSRSGNHSSTWRRGEVTIQGEHLHAYSYAKFKATRGGDFYTQIALDDFYISDGSCRGEDISCNFELGWCGWTSTNGLRRVSGRGSIHGPTTDKSSQDGGGFYLMRDTNSPHAVDTFTSPVITVFSRRMTSGCLVFWHYLSPREGDGRPIATIQKRYSGGSVENFYKISTQASGWQRWTIDITENQAFQFVFQWISPDGFRRVVALDEIQLLEGQCNLLDLKTCSPQEYRCGTGNCIPISSACDGISDCSDGSDELPDACCTLSACPEGMFCCRNRKCVDGDWACDGDNDCGDWSDEDHCLATGTCPPDRFQCTDKVRCISRRYHCNGELDCLDGSDEEGCPGMPAYVSPAVLAVVVVLGIILIILVFVKVGMAIRNGTCRLPGLRRFNRGRGRQEEDEEAGPPPFTLSEYQLPPDYSDAVNNPAYLPTTSREKKMDEPLPPEYDRVIKGEFVQTSSSRDIELLKESLKNGAMSNGVDNCGYASDSDITFRPRSEVSFNLAGSADLDGVSDSQYIQPPRDDDGPPPYLSRPASRQASIRRSLRRSSRRPSNRHATGMSSGAITASHFRKLESRILRNQHPRNVPPTRTHSAPEGEDNWAYYPDPLIIRRNRNHSASSDA